MKEREAAERIAEILREKKAEDVQVIHVGDKTIIADYFVVCSGRSAPHVKALCDEIEEKNKEGDPALTRLRTDGYREGRWIIIDFGTVLVHIFHPEEREYYKMERLWTSGN